MPGLLTGPAALRHPSRVPFCRQASRDRRDWPDSAERSLWKDRAENLLWKEPTEKRDMTEPADPIDRTDPTDPMDRIDPFEPLVFFVVAYNTLLGVKTIPHTLRNAAASLGAGRWAVLTEVLLPGALPNIVTGIRTGLGFAWRCLIAAESVPSSR